MKKGKMKILQKSLFYLFSILVVTSCVSDVGKTYITRTLELAGSAEGLPYQLSPDGNWLVSDMCFTPNYDAFYLIDMLDGRKIPVDIIEGIPIDYRSICGMYWSPDSHSFVALGAVSPPEKSFIVIFDISNPDNVQQSVFQWHYDTNVGIEWSPDSSMILSRDRKGQTNFFN